VATSAVPALIDAMVATFDAALSANVYDGYGNSDDPGDFLMVGIDDPDSDDWADAATTKQDWANANYTARSEEGDIICAALSWNGDGNQKAARDAVYATQAAVETALRANPSLGVSSVLWTSFGTDASYRQIQGQHGAASLLIFRIFFRAQL
jgi:hypothetical protein